MQSLDESKRKDEVNYSNSELWEAVDSKSREKIVEILVKKFSLKENGGAVEIVSNLLMKTEVDSLREVVLRSVDLANCLLVEMLLDRLVDLGLAESQPCPSSNLYPSHMTPLLLASIRNNLKMVSLLLNRSHSILVPHRANCSCNDCSEERKGGENVESRMKRIDTYRAISSSAYLWLASHDPVLFAMNLAIELQNCAQVEQEFKEEYGELSERVKQFVRRVAQQCRNADEVGTLLARKEGIPVYSSTIAIPRINLALNASMKDFLSDLCIQAQIQIAWNGDWADWYVKPQWYNFLVRLLPHTLFYPITSVAFLLSGGRLFKSYNNPRARYMSYFASYVIFLINILYVTLRDDEPDLRGFTKNKFKLAMTWLIWYHLMGMIWFDFLTFSKKGSHFYDVWWSWFDTLLWTLFSISFYAYIRAEIEAERGEVETLAAAPREKWAIFDMQLVAEAFYAGGTILAFWRMFFFLQLSRRIGPTIISIGMCIKFIIPYLVIMVVVIMSFGIGMRFIYHGYAGHSYVNAEGEKIVQLEKFLRTDVSIRSLWWSFFGYLPPWDSEIVSGSLGIDPKYQDPIGHALNRFIGEVIAMIFHVVILIILLNLMVAMMTTVACWIIEIEDTEWKYIRTHLRLQFFPEFNSLPPPLNLVHWITSWPCFFYDNRHRIQFRWPDLFHLEPKADQMDDEKYGQLMRTLFTRYLRKNKDL